MTILLALASRRGAAIASDSARTESNGSQSTETDKTFAVDDWLIGGIAGLLEFSGTDTASHARKALEGGPFPLRDAVSRLRDYFEKNLPQIAEAEVATPHRKIEFLVIGREQVKFPKLSIRSCEFRQSKFYNSSSFDPFALTGDMAARTRIEPMLQEERHNLGHAWPNKLQSVAQNLIQEGIAASGPHPSWPAVKACAGHACVRIMHA